MLELESAVKKLQLERDALAVKADTLERCLLTGSDIVKPEPLVGAEHSSYRSAEVGGMSWPFNGRERMG